MEILKGVELQRTETRGTQAYYAAAGGYDMEYSDSQWTSWLVPMIVVANVAMFIVTMLVNNCPKKNNGFQGDCVAKFLGRLSFQPLRENPLFGPSSSTDFGCIPTILPSNEVPQLFSWSGPPLKPIRPSIEATPLHCVEAHVLHESPRALSTSRAYHRYLPGALNSFVQVFDDSSNIARSSSDTTCCATEPGYLHNGIRLEQQFGFVRVGVIYLLSGIGGSILSCLFMQRSISVGASGALFGLLGAMLSELLTNWTIYSNKAAALFTLLVIIVVNLAVGILPHVDNFAHIGGFLTGFLLGFKLLLRPQFGWVERHRLLTNNLKSKYTACQVILWIVATVLLIVWFTVGLVMLFKGENANEKCSWCHYLSCVPTSRWSC